MKTLFDFSVARNRLAWSLFLTAIFINTNYAQFSANNQMEQLPMIYRALDVNYLKNDWYTNTNDRFNHRTGFITLVSLFSRALGLQNTYMLLTVVGVWLAVWAILELTALLWKEELPRPAQALQFLVSIGLGMRFSWGTLGTPGGTGVSLEAAHLGIPIAYVGIVFLLRGNLWLAGVSSLIASAIHPSAAPDILFLSLIGWWYHLDGGQRREKRRFILPLLLTGLAPMMVLASYAFSNQVTPQQARQAMEVLIYQRMPHHFAPFTWPLFSWLQFGACIAFVFLVRTQVKVSRFLDGFFVAAVVFALSGCLPFLLGTGIQLVKLQPFRMTTLVPLVGALYFGRYMGVLASRSRSDFALAIMMGAALLLNRYTAFFPPPDQKLLLTPFVWTLAFAAFLAVRHFLPQTAKALQWVMLCPWWLAFLPDNLRLNSKIYLLYVLGIMIYGAWINIPRLSFAPSGRFVLPKTAPQYVLILAALLGFNIYRVKASALAAMPLGSSTERPLFAWVRSHTPPQAVFMTPPILENFGHATQRAVVVNFKCFPFRDTAILQWQERVDAIDNAIASYPADPSPWRKLAQRFQADYIVLPTSKPLNTPPVFKDKNFAVYKAN